MTANTPFTRLRPSSLKDQQFKNDHALFMSFARSAYPRRRMKFMDLDTKKISDFTQVYVQPTGWVTITSKYDAAKPREFPVANNELELYSPDDLHITPKTGPSKVWRGCRYA
jgi:hypothetical protein